MDSLGRVQISSALTCCFSFFLSRFWGLPKPEHLIIPLLDFVLCSRRRWREPMLFHKDLHVFAMLGALHVPPAPV